MADTAPRVIDILISLGNGENILFRHLRQVDDLMSLQVKTLTLDHTVQDALALMKSEAVRHIPIVDGEGGSEVYVGLVSERDILRQLSAFTGSLAEPDRDQRHLKERLSAVLTRNHVTAGPGDLLFDSVQMMIKYRSDSLPVVTPERKIVGIITTVDILRVFILSELMQQYCNRQKNTTGRLIDLVGNGRLSIESLMRTHLQSVADIMATEILTVSPEDTVARALELMMTRKFRHLPVVDEKKRVIGIISDRDVLRELSPADQTIRKEEERIASRDNLFRVEENDKSLRMPLRSLMSTDATTVEPNTSLSEAARLLVNNERKIGCLPVIDQAGMLRGIVTTTDFLRAMLVIDMARQQSAPL